MSFSFLVIKTRRVNHLTTYTCNYNNLRKRKVNLLGKRAASVLLKTKQSWAIHVLHSTMYLKWQLSIHVVFSNIVTHALLCYNLHINYVVRNSSLLMLLRYNTKLFKGKHTVLKLHIFIFLYRRNAFLQNCECFFGLYFYFMLYQNSYAVMQ